LYAWCSALADRGTLPDIFHYAFFVRGLLSVLLLAPLLGGMSHLVVARRLSFFSAALGICLLVAVTKRFNIHQVEAVMFGSLLTVTDTDLAILLAVGVVIGLVFG